MSEPLALRRYDDFLGIETIGQMWALERGSHRLVCDLTTHPLGWERQ